MLLASLLLWTVVLPKPIGDKLEIPVKASIDKLAKAHAELLPDIKTDWFAKGIPGDRQFILLSTLDHALFVEINDDGYWSPTTFMPKMVTLRECKAIRFPKSLDDLDGAKVAYTVKHNRGYWVDKVGKDNKLVLYELKQ